MLIVLPGQHLLKGTGAALGRGAVACALEDPEETVEGADGLTILMREDAGDLMEVGQVVRCPRGE